MLEEKKERRRQRIESHREETTPIAPLSFVTFKDQESARAAIALSAASKDKSIPVRNDEGTPSQLVRLC